MKHTNCINHINRMTYITRITHITQNTKKTLVTGDSDSVKLRVMVIV